jgi:Big-like domain-containing protein
MMKNWHRTAAPAFLAFIIVANCDAPGEPGVDTAEAIPLPGGAIIRTSPRLALVLKKGETYSIQGWVEGSQQEILSSFEPRWTSAEPGVATVSPEGDVIAVDVGRTELTATAGGQSQSIAVIVNPNTPWLEEFEGRTKDSCSYDDSGVDRVLGVATYRFVTPDSLVTKWEWHAANSSASYSIKVRTASARYLIENGKLVATYADGRDSGTFSAGVDTLRLDAVTYYRCRQTDRAPALDLLRVVRTPQVLTIRPTDTTIAVGDTFSVRTNVVQLYEEYTPLVHSSRPAVARFDGTYRDLGLARNDFRIVGRSAGTTRIWASAYGSRASATVHVK